MGDKKYKIETDNLALPEIRTGIADKPVKDERSEQEIVYEPLAVPEVHIKHKKK